MDNLSSWLGVLGLEQYTAVFESQGIDLRSLPLLSDGELADLGVLLGHRKLLLKAVTTLDRAPAIPLPEVPSSADGERRQLTVLFCDLVGSTALARRLDPEALRDVLQLYQRDCRAVIDRYAGHVAQYLGDGIVVYFGFPRAHEDDAERAVRAALDIVASIGKLSTPERLRVRIGIATGSVVVGESTSSDATGPSAAVGETPNLAARLQAIAGPDQIVVATTTYRLLGDTFEVEDLGEHDLKGIEHPVRARRICALAVNDSRFAARGGRHTPFVGREDEVALLLARWRQATDGEGQVVLLVGEPGIGKSRITQVLQERLTGMPPLRLKYQCSPYHSGSAFYPIIEGIERAAGFERHDDPQRKLDKLENTLALSADELPLAAPLFAQLLSLPIDRYPSRMLSPQKQKELTIAALVDQPVRLARQQPVMMMVEDAHWIDPSSLETLGLMVEGIRHSAILLVITCRPELVPAWTGHGNVTLLNLNRLSRRQGTAMMKQLTGGRSLPDAVVAQLLDRTDGVPLFVEELTRNVLEAGSLHEVGDRYELRGTFPALTVPSTLQDSLMARLDRLAPVKEVAQIGACIGREFSYELLAATALVPTTQLDVALDQLVSSELVFRAGNTAETLYSFKHALVQDAAYESLLKTRRKQIHERIALALAKDFPDLVRTRPEVLAQHLTLAGLADAALAQWIAASWLAHNNSRFREALGHVDQGLTVVGQASAERRTDFEFALLTAGAVCHWALAGYASVSAAGLLARAEALISKVSDQNLLLRGVGPMVVQAFITSDMPKAEAMATRCVALAEASQSVESRVIAYAAVSMTLCQLCEFKRVQGMLEFVTANYDVDKRLTYVRSNDVKVVACAWLALVYSVTGYLDKARGQTMMAVEHAISIAHPFSLTLALSLGSIRLADAGAHEEALAMSRRAIDLCDAQRLPFWKGWAMVGEGAALSGLGEHESAVQRLTEAAAHLAATGARNDRAYLHAWRAIALAHMGRFDAARREADDGSRQCAQVGQRMSLPRLALARGVVEMLDPGAPAAAAEEWLNTALAGARSIGKRTIELRAATALARLWLQQNRQQEAQELLSPIFNSFTEGFEYPDLKDARALLDALEG